MFNDNTPAWDNGETPATGFTGKAKIRVMGVGGAGNNAVNNMIDAGIVSAEFIAVNTDAQILACSKAPTRIQIGVNRTKGLGAGAEPEAGREAAEESKEELAAAIEGTDLLFITAGMGGGTGTGAAPVIAKIAKDMKILTVAVVTQPFMFEGKHRMDNAIKGIDNLRKYVDTIIIVPNDKIIDVVSKNTSIPEALRVADDVLKQGIRGIADVIVTPSLINLDFADVRTVLKDKGLAYMGVGVAKGENRMIEAVRLAVNSPLLETTIEGATNILINITGGNDLTLMEAKAANELIHGVVDYSANIIFGACIDENIQEEVEVTVIATGFPSVNDKPTAAATEAIVRAAQQQYVARGIRTPIAPAAPASAPAAPSAAPAAPAMPAVPRAPEQGEDPRFFSPAEQDVYARPAAPQPQTEDPEPEKPEEEPHGHGIPLFVRHMLGKKK